jgi:F-type H+-transporting ATPase subunit gamma
MAALSAKQNAFMASTSFATGRKVVAVQRGALQVAAAGMKETRDRLASVKNTSKITEAMKLVAAAKVRRAQEAVINARPFSENLIKVLYGINQRLRVEDVESPLCTIRPVKSVLMVVVTGDRGLCGGYNNFILKSFEKRYKELTALGVDVKIIAVGRKGQQYMKRRPKFNVIKLANIGKVPTMADAQGISDSIFASFVAAECDKVELIYTKFLSLISSKPATQTLLPLSPSGELCNTDGTCVDAADDEIFKLTTKDGKFEVEREKKPIETEALDPGLIFEQEPAQLLDTLLPLYLNSCLLRILQESLASELAARMTAMGNATDNAKELRKVLNASYNRTRQAKITQELAEIVAGASAGR